MNIDGDVLRCEHGEPACSSCLRMLVKHTRGKAVVLKNELQRVTAEAAAMREGIELLSTAAEALLHDYQDLHDNDVKRDLFEQPTYDMIEKARRALASTAGQSLLAAHAEALAGKDGEIERMTRQRDEARAQARLAEQRDSSEMAAERRYFELLKEAEEKAKCLAITVNELDTGLRSTMAERDTARAALSRAEGERDNIRAATIEDCIEAYPEAADTLRLLALMKKGP